MDRRFASSRATTVLPTPELPPISRTFQFEILHLLWVHILVIPNAKSVRVVDAEAAMTPRSILQAAHNGHAVMDQSIVPFVHSGDFDAQHHVDRLNSWYSFIFQLDHFDHGVG